MNTKLDESPRSPEDSDIEAFNQDLNELRASIGARLKLEESSERGDPPSLLTLGWQPNYSSEFDIHLTPNGKPSDLYETIRRWVNNCYPKGENPVYLPPQPFISGAEKSSKLFRTAISIDTIGYSDTNNSCDHWLMTLDQPDRDYRERTWQTRIGISRVTDSHYILSLSNKHRLDASFIGEPPEFPRPSTPKIVRWILNEATTTRHEPRWHVKSGSGDMLSSPVTVNDASLNRLIDKINDPKRRALLVAISKDPEELDYPINPEEIARELAGLAQVVAVDLTHTGVLDIAENIAMMKDSGVLAFKPNHKFGPDMLPYNGFARIYFPATHPYFLPQSRAINVDDLYDSPSYAIEQMRSACLRHMIGLTPRDLGNRGIVSVWTKDQIDNNRRVLQLQELQSRLSETRAAIQDSQTAIDPSVIADYEEYIQSLEGEYQEESQGHLQALSTIENLQVELRMKDNELSLAQQRIKELQDVITLLKSRKGDQSLEVSNPKDIVEMLNYIEKMYSDRVIVHDDAKKGARKMLDDGCLKVTSSSQRAMKLIEVMATTLYDMKFNSPTKVVDINRFRDQTQFEITFGESLVVDQKPELRRLRQVEYDGKTIYAPAHAKYGSRPGNCIRVYFIFDEAKQKIVITKVAEHLATGSSKKSGEAK